MRTVFAVFLVVGCSSSSDPAAPPAGDVGLTEDTAAVAPDTDGADSAANAEAATESGPDVAIDTGSSSYPPGPYGSAKGDVVADLAFEGYVRFGETTGLASSAPYGPTSFADLRTKSPQKWAIVHVSGFT